METSKLTVTTWIALLLLIQYVAGASVYTATINLPKPQPESICSHQIERQMKSEGKESSLILELNPGATTHKTCMKVLIAPESYGFFVHVAPVKDNKITNNESSGKYFHKINTKITNKTASCPISMFSADDPLMTAWKIDPCELEIRNDKDEPAKFLPRHLKILWDHGGTSPPFRIIITVFGKGYLCDKNGKFPCMRFGLESFLCIAKDLVCDGYTHCPKGLFYDNDEDVELCSKRKQDDFDDDIFEHLPRKIFHNFLSKDTGASVTATTKLNFSPKETINDIKKIPHLETNTHSKQNITHGSIGGDLSKYGPWGYLMLGMLLCGGALLVCGLWECCCRQNKSNDTNITASTLQPNVPESDTASPNNTIQDTSPPNYEELDPPPAYSALFPNQKTSTEIETRSNTTNSNLGSTQTSNS